MVLDICAVTIPTFFMEGGSELQLHALNVVRTVRHTSRCMPPRHSR
jgi:hypothetical protein